MIEKELIYLPRPSSKYKGCYPLHFEKRIIDLIKTENFLHLFSGSSKMGFRLDIKFKCEIEDFLRPDLVCNVELLPFKNNVFEGIFSDPPYNEDFSQKLYNCKYPRYNLWTNEISRVCKINGYIGIMQNYIVPSPKNCKYIKILVILTRIKQFPKIVTIFQKIKDSGI